MDHFRSLLLDSAGVGLAVVEPTEYRIIMHNPMFNEMFRGVRDGTATLATLIPAFDAQAVAD